MQKRDFPEQQDDGGSDDGDYIPFLLISKSSKLPSLEQIESGCSRDCIVVVSGRTCPGTDRCDLATLEDDTIQSEPQIITNSLGCFFTGG